MPGAYALVGARYVERGYSAIPIAPGSKAPGHMRAGGWVGLANWDRFADRRPTHFEHEHWAASDAGVCVVMGQASNWLVAIDIDVDDPDVQKAVLDRLPYTPVRKRGAKGLTLFFRGPGVVSRSYNQFANGRIVRRLLDIIGPGRQTVVPPTIHCDTGKPYAWVGEAALDDTDPAELPILDPDIGRVLAEALRSFGYLPEAPAAPHLNGAAISDDETPHRSLNNAALARLVAWVPRLQLYRCRAARGGYEAVPTWRASNTGRPIEKRKLNLKIHPSGIRDMGADRSFTPLDLVKEACGLGDDLDTAFRQLSDWIGWGPSEPIAVAEPPKAIIVTEDGTTADVETGEIIEAPQFPALAPPSSPDTPSGVIAEIANWILSVSRRPQPRFAVAAALSLVGTVASRQMMTPEFGHLNLYMLIIARSGNGKDAPIKCVASALAKAGLADLIGPDGLQSDVALYDHINRHPVSILPVDEFGDFIAASSGPKAPPHTLKVMAAIRKAWQSGLMPTPHAASRHGVLLHSPCMSLYCASTPEQFYSAVGHSEAVNGFLNRFLVVHVMDRASAGEGGPIDDVPAGVAASLQAIADRPGGTNFGRFRAGQAQHPLNDKAYVAPWAASDARRRWKAYEEEIGQRLEAGHKGKFAERCAENALRVATILAISDNIDDPRVTRDHLEWAIGFVERSLADMISGYDSHVPLTESAILTGRILDFLKSKGGTATRREIFRTLHRRFKRAQDVDDLMKVLAESGEVETLRTVPAAGGPASVSYRILL